MSIQNSRRNWSDNENIEFVKLIKKHEVHKIIKGKRFADVLLVFHNINKEMHKIGLFMKNDTQLFLKYKELRAENLRKYGVSYIDYNQSSHEQQCQCKNSHLKTSIENEIFPSKSFIVPSRTHMPTKKSNTNIEDIVCKSAISQIDYDEKILAKQNYKTEENYEIHQSNTIVHSQNEQLNEKNISTMCLFNSAKKHLEHERSGPQMSIRNRIMLTEADLANPNISQSRLTLPEIAYIKRSVNRKVQEKLGVPDESLRNLKNFKQRKETSEPKIKTQIPISTNNNLQIVKPNQNRLHTRPLKKDIQSESEPTFNITSDVLNTLKAQVLNELIEQLNKCICPNCDMTHICCCRQKRIPRYRLLILRNPRSLTNLPERKWNFPYTLPTYRNIRLIRPKRIYPGINYVYIRPSYRLPALACTIDDDEPINKPMLLKEKLENFYPTDRFLKTSLITKKRVHFHELILQQNKLKNLIPSYRLVHAINSVDTEIFLPKGQKFKNLIPSYRLVNANSSVDTEIFLPKGQKFKNLIPSYRLVNANSSVDTEIFLPKEQKFKNLIPSYRLINLISAVDREIFLPKEKKLKNLIPNDRFVNLITSVDAEKRVIKPKSLPYKLIPAYRHIFLTATFDRKNIDLVSNVIQNKLKTLIPTYRFLNLTLSIDLEERIFEPNSFGCRLIPAYRHINMTTIIHAKNIDNLSKLFRNKLEVSVPTYRLVNITAIINTTNIDNLSKLSENKFQRLVPTYRLVNFRVSFHLEKPKALEDSTPTYRHVYMTSSICAGKYDNQAKFSQHKYQKFIPSFRFVKITGNDAGKSTQVKYPPPGHRFSSIQHHKVDPNLRLYKRHSKVKKSVYIPKPIPKSVPRKTVGQLLMEQKFFAHNYVEVKRRYTQNRLSLQTKFQMSDKNYRFLHLSNVKHSPKESPHEKLIRTFRFLHLSRSINSNVSILPLLISRKLENLIPSYRVPQIIISIDSEKRIFSRKKLQNKFQDLIPNYRLVKLSPFKELEKCAGEISPNKYQDIVPTYRLSYLGEKVLFKRRSATVKENIHNKFEDLNPAYRLVNTTTGICSKKLAVHSDKIDYRLNASYRSTQLTRSCDKNLTCRKKPQNKFEVFTPTYGVVNLTVSIDSEKLCVKPNKVTNRLIPAYSRVEIDNKSARLSICVQNKLEDLIPTYRLVNITTAVCSKKLAVHSDKIDSTHIARPCDGKHLTFGNEPQNKFEVFIPTYCVNLTASIDAEKVFVKPNKVTKRLIPTYPSVEIDNKNAYLRKCVQNKLEDLIPTYRLVNITTAICSKKTAVQSLKIENQLTPEFLNINVRCSLNADKGFRKMPQNKLQDLVPTCRLINIAPSVYSNMVTDQSNKIENRLNPAFRSINMTSPINADNRPTKMSPNKLYDFNPTYYLVNIAPSFGAKQFTVQQKQMGIQLIPLYRNLQVHSDARNATSRNVQQNKFKGLIPCYGLVNLTASIDSEKVFVQPNKVTNRLIPTYPSAKITTSIYIKNAPFRKSVQNKLDLSPTYRLVIITTSTGSEKLNVHANKIQDLIPTYRLVNITASIDSKKLTLQSTKIENQLIPAFRSANLSNSIDPETCFPEMPQIKFQDFIPPYRLVNIARSIDSKKRSVQSNKIENQLIPAFRNINMATSINDRKTFCKKPQNKFQCLIPTYRLVNIALLIDSKKGPVHANKIENQLTPAFRNINMGTTINAGKSFCKIPQNKFQCLIPTYRLVNIALVIDSNKGVVDAKKIENQSIPAFRNINMATSINAEKSSCKVPQNKFQCLIPNYRLVNIASQIDLKKRIVQSDKIENQLIPAFRNVNMANSIIAERGFPKIPQNKFQDLIPTYRLVNPSIDSKKGAIQSYKIQKQLIPAYRNMNMASSINSEKGFPEMRQNKLEDLIPTYRFVNIVSSTDARKLALKSKRIENELIPAFRSIDMTSPINADNRITKMPQNKYQDLIPTYRFVKIVTSIRRKKRPKRKKKEATQKKSKAVERPKKEPKEKKEKVQKQEKIEKPKITKPSCCSQISSCFKKISKPSCIKLLVCKFKNPFQTADKDKIRSLDSISTALSLSQVSFGGFQYRSIPTHRIVNITTSIAKDNHLPKTLSQHKLQDLIPTYRLVNITTSINLEKLTSKKVPHNKFEDLIPTQRFVNIIKTIQPDKPFLNKLKKCIPIYRLVHLLKSSNKEQRCIQSKSLTKLKKINSCYRFGYLTTRVSNKPLQTRANKLTPAYRFPYLNWELSTIEQPLSSKNNLNSKCIKQHRFINATQSIDKTIPFDKSTYLSNCIPANRYANILSSIDSETYNVQAKSFKYKYRFISTCTRKCDIGEKLSPSYRFVNGILSIDQEETAVPRLFQNKYQKSIPNKPLVNLTMSINSGEAINKQKISKYKLIPKCRFPQLTDSIRSENLLISTQSKLSTLMPNYRFASAMYSIDPEILCLQLETRLEKLIPAYRLNTIVASIGPERSASSPQSSTKISKIPLFRFSVVTTAFKLEKRSVEPKSENYRFAALISSIDLQKPFEQPLPSKSKFGKCIPAYRFIFSTYLSDSGECNIQPKYLDKKFISTYRFVKLNTSVITTNVLPRKLENLTPCKRFLHMSTTVNIEKQCYLKFTEGKLKHWIPSVRLIRVTNTIDLEKGLDQLESKKKKLKKIIPSNRFLYLNNSVHTDKYFITQTITQKLQKLIPSMRFVYMINSVDFDKPYRKSIERKHENSIQWNRFVSPTYKMDLKKSSTSNYPKDKIKDLIPTYRFIFATASIDTQKPYLKSIEEKFESITVNRFVEFSKRRDLVRLVQERKSKNFNPTYRFVLMTYSVDVVSPVLLPQFLETLIPTYRFVNVPTKNKNRESGYHVQTIEEKLKKLNPSIRFINVPNSINVVRPAIHPRHADPKIKNCIPIKRFVFVSNSNLAEYVIQWKTVPNELIPTTRFVEFSISYTEPKYLQKQKKDYNQTYRFLFLADSIHQEKSTVAKKLHGNLEYSIPTYRLINLGKKKEGTLKISSDRFVNFIRCVDRFASLTSNTKHEYKLLKIDDIIPTYRSVYISKFIDSQKQPKKFIEYKFIQRIPTYRSIQLPSSVTKEKLRDEISIQNNRFVELIHSIDKKKPELMTVKRKLELSASSTRFVDVNKSIDAEEPTLQPLSQQNKIMNCIPTYRFVPLLQSIDIENVPKFLPKKKLTSVPIYRFVAIKYSIVAHKPKLTQKKFENFPSNRFVHFGTTLHEAPDEEILLEDKMKTVINNRFVHAGTLNVIHAPEEKILKTQKPTPIYRFVSLSSSIDCDKPFYQQKRKKLPTYRFFTVTVSIDPIRPYQKRFLPPVIKFPDVTYPQETQETVIKKRESDPEETVVKKRESIKDKVINLIPASGFIPIMKKHYKAVAQPKMEIPTYRFIFLNYSTNTECQPKLRYKLENIPTDRFVNIDRTRDLCKIGDQQNKMDTVVPKYRLVSIDPEIPCVKAESQNKLKNSIPTYRFVPLSGKISYDKSKSLHDKKGTPTYRFIYIDLKKHSYEKLQRENKFQKTANYRFVPLSKSIDNEAPCDHRILIRKKMETLTPSNRFDTVTDSIDPVKPEHQLLQKCIPTDRFVYVTELYGRRKLEHPFEKNLIPQFRFPYISKPISEEISVNRPCLIDNKLRDLIPSERFVYVPKTVDVIQHFEKTKKLIPSSRFIYITRRAKPLSERDKLRKLIPHYRLANVYCSINREPLQPFQKKGFPAYRFLYMLTTIDSIKPNIQPMKTKKLYPSSVHVQSLIKPEKVVIENKLQNLIPTYRFIGVPDSVDFQKPELKKVKRFSENPSFVQVKKLFYIDTWSRHKTEHLIPTYRIVNSNKSLVNPLIPIQKNLFPTHRLLYVTDSINSKQPPTKAGKNIANFVPTYRFLYVNDKSTATINLLKKLIPSVRLVQVMVSKKPNAKPRLLKNTTPLYRFVTVNNLIDHRQPITNKYMIVTRRFVGVTSSIGIRRESLEKKVPTYRFVYVTLFINQAKHLDHSQKRCIDLKYRFPSIISSIDLNKPTWTALQDKMYVMNRLVHVTESIDPKQPEPKKILTPAYRFCHVTTSIDIWKPDFHPNSLEEKMKNYIPTYRFSHITISRISEKYSNLEKLTPTYRLVSVTQKIDEGSPIPRPMSTQSKLKNLIPAYRFLGRSSLPESKIQNIQNKLIPSYRLVSVSRKLDKNYPEWSIKLKIFIPQYRFAHTNKGLTRDPGVRLKSLEDKLKYDVPTYRLLQLIDQQKLRSTIPNQIEKLTPKYRLVSVAKSNGESKVIQFNLKGLPSYRFVTTASHLNPQKPMIQLKTIEDKLKQDIPTYRFIYPITPGNLAEPSNEPKQKLTPTYRLVSVSIPIDRKRPVEQKPGKLKLPSYRLINTSGSIDREKPRAIPDKLTPTYRLVSVSETTDHQIPRKSNDLIPFYRLVNTTRSVDQEKPIVQLQNLQDKCTPEYRFTHTAISVGQQKPISELEKLTPTNRLVSVGETIDPESQKCLESKIKNCIPTYRHAEVTSSIDNQSFTKPKMGKNIPTYRFVSVNSSGDVGPPFQVCEGKNKGKNAIYRFVPMNQIKDGKPVEDKRDSCVKVTPTYRLVSVEGTKECIQKIPSDTIGKHIPIYRFVEVSNSIDKCRPILRPKIGENPLYRFVRLTETIDKDRPIIKTCCKNCQCQLQYYPPF